MIFPIKKYFKITDTKIIVFGDHRIISCLMAHITSLWPPDVSLNPIMDGLNPLWIMKEFVMDDLIKEIMEILPIQVALIKKKYVVDTILTVY